MDCTLYDGANQYSRRTCSGVFGREISKYKKKIHNTHTQVRRTNHLFDLEGPSSYGSNFQYEERALAKNKAHAKALERLNRVSVDAREEMIERGSLPKPGQGPDESTFFFVI